MCTVTIIPLGDEADPHDYPTHAATIHASGEATGGATGGTNDWAIGLRRRIRIACNRDESRSRPAALPPVIRDLGDRRVIMPVDPVSDGTWIAVNDAGLAAVLLNVNAPRISGGMKGEATLSRGLLVPRAMACATFAEAEHVCCTMDPRRQPPFRLVLVDDHSLSQFLSNGDVLRHERGVIGDAPHLFTSSGLGDHLVEPPRRELFAKMFPAGANWASQQEAYHRHAWPDRPHLSVCMERPEARTVSHTIIDIEPRRVAMTYVPDAPGRAPALPPLTLARSPAEP